MAASRTQPRRGVALMDAILGGLMLAIALGAILTLASRSTAIQAEGSKRLVAAWLLDELLSMVLMEGPIDYPKIHATHGGFDAPFEEFEFDVNINDIGLGKPFLVTATVRWRHGPGVREAHAMTYIADVLWAFQKADDPDVKRGRRQPPRWRRWRDWLREWLSVVQP